MYGAKLKTTNLNKAKQLNFEAPLLKAGINKNIGTSNDTPSFMTTMNKAIENLNDINNVAVDKLSDYSAGKDIEPTEVMLALDKASMFTNLTVQVRNKLVEGYRELKNTQI